jgi:hypothetical protein
MIYGPLYKKIMKNQLLDVQEQLSLKHVQQKTSLFVTESSKYCITLLAATSK